MQKDDINHLALHTINSILCEQLNELSEVHREKSIAGMTRRGLEALLETASNLEYYEVCVTIRQCWHYGAMGR